MNSTMLIVESAQDPQATLASLTSQKASLEAQLESQRLILEANNCTMSTPLVDAQGFPVANIDILGVRKARVRILELRNDLERCIEEVARALEDVYASRAAAAITDDGASQEATNTKERKAEERKPFARVDGVAPGSPAHTAGLQREDLVVSAASETTTVAVSTDENPMARLITLVGANENVSCFPLMPHIDVVLMRFTRLDSSDLFSFEFSETSRLYLLSRPRTMELDHLTYGF